jgi:hypothetical protein
LEEMVRKLGVMAARTDIKVKGRDCKVKQGRTERYTPGRLLDNNRITAHSDLTVKVKGEIIGNRVESRKREKEREERSGKSIDICRERLELGISAV